MNLNEYLSAPDAESANSLAVRLGVTHVMISQWRHQKRDIPPARCVALEQISNGTMTRRDLRPADYWRFWPDLAAA